MTINPRPAHFALILSAVAILAAPAVASGHVPGPRVTAPAPKAVTGLTASAGVGSIVVSWTAPTNARKAKVSGYRVTYRRLGTAKWRSLPRTGGSATSATISGLKAGSYSVGVVALTPYRHGSFASVRVTTSDPSIGSLAIGPTSANDTNPTPALPSPGAPRNFTATGGSGKVTLAWQAPESDGGSAIVAYQLRIRAAGSAGWFAPTNVRGGALSYELSLGGTSAYEFQVRAVNGNGAGAWSVTSSAAPTA